MRLLLIVYNDTNSNADRVGTSGVLEVLLTPNSLQTTQNAEWQYILENQLIWTSYSPVTSNTNLYDFADLIITGVIYFRVMDGSLYSNVLKYTRTSSPVGSIILILNIDTVESQGWENHAGHMSVTITDVNNSQIYFASHGLGYTSGDILLNPITVSQLPLTIATYEYTAGASPGPDIDAHDSGLYTLSNYTNNDSVSVGMGDIGSITLNHN